MIERKRSWIFILRREGTPSPPSPARVNGGNCRLADERKGVGATSPTHESPVQALAETTAGATGQVIAEPTTEKSA